MEKNTKQYQAAEIEIVTVDQNDIICTSGKQVNANGSSIENMGAEENWGE